MRGRWRSFLLAMGAVAAVTACAARALPRATPADAERAQRRWPEATTADLDRGRSLYAARCSNCHQPVAPGSVAPVDWPTHVSEMKERASLNDAEATLVIRYLITMAERRP
jgi:cytochrome c5